MILHLHTGNPVEKKGESSTKLTTNLKLVTLHLHTGNHTAPADSDFESPIFLIWCLMCQVVNTSLSRDTERGSGLSVPVFRGFDASMMMFNEGTPVLLAAPARRVAHLHT